MGVVSAGLGRAAGPLSVVIGAISLALGTVVAGFVPAIRDAALRRRDDQQAAEAAHERWAAVGEPTAEAVHCGPATRLRPDSAIVDSTGRDLRVCRICLVNLPGPKAEHALTVLVARPRTTKPRTKYLTQGYRSNACTGPR
jgi:hypothetical protein